MRHIFFILLLFISLLACTDQSENLGSNATTGSYATMITIGHHLYVLNKTELYTYDITDQKNPALLDKTDVGFDIESLYHYEGVLLIGSQANMYIYQLDEKGIPKHVTSTSYFSNVGVSSCDPIVAQNDIAYVTLSTTTIGPCGFSQFVNELRVYDISTIEQPVLKNTVFMDNPKGLAVKGNNLYICDQIKGLVIFDISNPEQPLLSKTFEGFSGYDALIKGEILLVVSEKKLLQFDIKDEKNVFLIGEIDL